jgi:hypothetical protein
MRLSLVRPGHLAGPGPDLAAGDVDPKDDSSPQQGDEEEVDDPEKIVAVLRINPRQRKFCALYASGFYSGAEAARLAGYSSHSARFAASRMLANDDIRLQIARHKATKADLQAREELLIARRLYDLSAAAEGAGDFRAAIAAMGVRVQMLSPRRGSR